MFLQNGELSINSHPIPHHWAPWPVKMPRMDAEVASSRPMAPASPTAVPLGASANLSSSEERESIVLEEKVALC
jgi:hypothetical protein